MTLRSNSRTATSALSVYLSLVLAAIPLAAGQDDELPEGPGKRIVEGVCAQCHEIEMVTIQNFTKSQWSHTVDVMVARGAHLAPDQIPIVIAYLAANFGKPESSASSPPASAAGSTQASALASTSTPASTAQAPPPLATTSTAPPPPSPPVSAAGSTPASAPASTATSTAVAASGNQSAGNQSGGCGAKSVSASRQRKKQKRFWGFLRKKTKEPACTGKEMATSDERGP
jgi:mono/diheme cytochrome c family protein